MATLTSEQLELFALFNPFAAAQYGRVLNDGTRFVHYTDAPAALGMLANKEIWLRNVRTMNDFMEVDHGCECLSAAYKKAGVRDRFRRCLDAVSPGLQEEIEKLFDGWSPHFNRITYVACFSEHDSSEETLGRLSMWRAYGGPTRLALVLNNTPFLTPNDALLAYSHPVAYLDHDEFSAHFEKFTATLEQHTYSVRSGKLDRARFPGSAFSL